MSSLYVLYENRELNLRLRRAVSLLESMEGVWNELRKWNTQRVARHDLAAMPDYLLRDIGIERGTIDDIVEGMTGR